MKLSRKKLIAWLSVVVLVLVILPKSSNAAAEALTNRKVTLSGTEASEPSQTGVTYTFEYTQAGTDTLGSVKFLFCTTASGTCTTPTGLSTTSATFGSYTGDSGTWTLNNTTNGAPYVTRTAAAGTAGTKTIVINNITNPNTTGTFYMRITTYSGTDGSTGADDTGTVAASTANQITLTGTVDESLTFCVGITVTANCSSTTGTAVSFSPDAIFDASGVTYGTSQFAAATNGGGGYVISVNGTTLTCGAAQSPPCSPSQTITALATQTASSSGSEQFGLNLRNNATPDVGSDVDGSGSATVHANYNTADQFRFVSGDTVASHSSATDFRRFTASYIVNINALTEAGQYTATMTYICTATF